MTHLRGFCKNCGHRVIMRGEKPRHFSPQRLVHCKKLTPEWYYSEYQLEIIFLSDEYDDWIAKNHPDDYGLFSLLQFIEKEPIKCNKIIEGDKE